MKRLALVGLLLVASCASGSREAEPFDGIWRSDGFGGYLTIDRGAIQVFEYGSHHCVLVAESGTRGISEVLSLEPDGRLLLQQAGRILRYDRIDQLPMECAEDEFFDDDPVRSFAIAADAIELHYAGSLDEDWSARRDALAAQLTAATTDAEFFAALTGLLGPVDDPQVRLSIQEGGEGVPEGVWSAFEAAGAERIRASIEGAEHLQAVDGTRGEGRLIAGIAADGIGYLGLTTLAPFDGGIEDTGDTIADVIDGLVETAQADFGLIIDLRVNDGGVEGLGMLVASRFVPEETFVVSRTARVEGTDEYVEAGSIIVRSAPTGVWPGSLVVLIGPGTSGAAELLVLALREVPGVTLVGTPTAGSVSPILARVLPVSWELGLPNQRTFDSSNTLVDGVGIIPDVVVETSAADLDGGSDPGLEKAIEILSTG